MIGVVGFAMLLSGASPAVQYAGTYLGAMGIYPTVPNTISWVANNSEGVYKRGIMIGIVNGWGNLNGIVSSNIYRIQDKPKYRPGHGIVLAYLLLFLMGGSALQLVLLRKENARRLAGKRDHWVEGKTEKEIEALGDQRYVRSFLACIFLRRERIQIYINSIAGRDLFTRFSTSTPHFCDGFTRRSTVCTVRIYIFKLCSAKVVSSISSSNPLT